MGSLSGGSDKVKPSPEMKALAKKAAEDWNHYYLNFRPAENIVMESIQATPDRIDEAQGIALTDVGMTRRDVLDNAHRSISGQSGRGLRMLAGFGSAGAMAKAQAENNAANLIENNELQGKIRLSGFGRGLGSLALDGLSGAAAQAASSAITKMNSDQELRQSYIDAAGEIGKGGVKAYQKSLVPSPSVDPFSGGYDSAPHDTSHIPEVWGN